MFKKKIALGVVFILSSCAALISHATTLSGKVFTDFSSNGTIDPSDVRGLDGGTVTVTAYAADGSACGTTTAAAAAVPAVAAATGSANWTITPAGSAACTSGPWRVEFSNLPTGYVPSGGTTATNGGATQFVAGGLPKTDINFGANRPDEYCQAEPMLCSYIYRLPFASSHYSLIRFPYNSGTTTLNQVGGVQDTPDAPTLVNSTPGSAMGGVFSLAWYRVNRNIYASAYVKRGQALPNGSGQIFSVDQTGAASPYVNLDTVFGAGTTGPVTGNPATLTSAGTTFSATVSPSTAGANPDLYKGAGKVALGGMKIYEDAANSANDRLFVVNLYDRQLYSVPLSGTLSNTTITRYPIPGSISGLTSGSNGVVKGCVANDVRPFGLGIFKGKIYAGVVCSAQSTHDRLDMRAYVFQFDPTTNVFNNTPVVEFALNYPRTDAVIFSTTLKSSANWMPWTDDFKINGSADRTNYAACASPTSTGITPLAGGAPDPGYRDSCPNLLGHTRFDTQRIVLYPSPMIADIAFDGIGTMVLGFRDRFVEQFNGTDPFPGVDSEAHGGGGPYSAPYPAGDLVKIPRVGVTSWSPATANTISAAESTFYATSFVVHEDTATGGLAQVPGRGDVVAAVYDGADEIPAVIRDTESIGFRWLDNSTGAALRQYRVADQQATNYTGSDSAAFSTGVYGKGNALGDIDVMCDSAPIEIGNRVWSDINNNGVQDPNEPGIAGVAVELWDVSVAGTPVKVGTAITAADGTYYFGNIGNVNMLPKAGVGTPTAVSDFYSVMPNTAYEIRIQNLNATALPATTVGNGSATGTSISQTSSNAVALGGAKLTTTNAADTAGGRTANTTNNATTDHFDSDASLNSGVSPAANTAVIAYTTGGAGNNNHTLDYGYVPSYSLGNRIWYDTNNDGVMNNPGVAGGEQPIGGVQVNVVNSSGAQLYLQADGTVSTATTGTRLTVITDANGYYRFDGLPAGDYFVNVDKGNWAAPGATAFPVGTLSNATTATPTAKLAGYGSSSNGTNGVTGTTSGTGSTNNNDKGIQPTTVGDYSLKGVTSGQVTLGAGSQPTSDLDTGATGAGAQSAAGDGNDNLTVDFGFNRLTVGDQLWVDANNDGLNVGESGTALSGVKVELYKGTTLVAVTTTDSNGNYVFTQQTNSSGVANGLPLVPGTDYKVSIPSGQSALTGYQSSAAPASQPAPNTAGNGTKDDGDKGTGTANAFSNVTETAVFTLGHNSTTTGTTANSNNTYATDQAGNDTGTSHKPDMDLGFFQPFDLKLTKNVTSSGPYTQGVSTVTYTLLVENLGPGPAGGAVTVKDKLPVGLTLTTPAPTGTGWSCTPTTGAAVEITCTRSSPVTPASIAANASLPLITINATVDLTAPTGALLNKAFVAPDPADSGKPELIPVGTTDSGYENASNVPVAVTNPSNNDDGKSITVGPATYAIGNRLWFDTNNDGVMNNPGIATGEKPVPAGVLLQLLDGSGNPVLVAGNPVTTTTDANGYYLFDNLAAGTYQVRVAASNWNPTTGLLRGYASSTGATATSVLSADNNKDHGIDPVTPDLYATQGVKSGNIILGGASNQTGSGEDTATGVPASTAGDALDNKTIDFGFYKLSVGNTVWNDANKDGTLNNSEVGINSVTVNLKDSTGTVIATTTTAGGGLYSFSQRTDGGPILPGNYTIEIPAGQNALQNMQSTNAVGTSESAPLSSDQTDAGQGTGNAFTTVTSSASFALAPQAQVGTGADGTGTNGTGSLNDSGITNQPRLDFGFFTPTYSLGNRIWFDTNNDGMVNNAEVGSKGVIVELLSAGTDGVFGTTDDVVTASQITDTNGYYRFDNLGAGTYAVRVAKENWSGLTAAQAALPAPSGVTVAAGNKPMAGYANSTPTETAANSTGTGSTVNMDKGVNPTTPAGYVNNIGTTAGGVTSRPVTLGIGNQPATDVDAGATGAGAQSSAGDANDNLTVDMGFYRLSVGDLVWTDTNNSATTAGDAVNPGINGVVLNLIYIDPVTSVETIVAQTTTATVAGIPGTYSFTEQNNVGGAAGVSGAPLIPGNYKVQVVSGVPAGFISSTDIASSSTPLTTNNDDNGVGISSTPMSNPFALTPYAQTGTGADGTGTNGTGSLNTTGTTNQPNVDFGFTQQAGVSVGNYVWIDSNGNGQQDTTEVGIAGVTATISKVGGGAVTDVLGNPVTTTQVTPASGLYQFTNLAPGQYIVTFSTIPTGYTVTTTGSPTSNGSQTGTNATDSNGLTATSSVLAAGQSDLTLDLGLVPAPVTVGNYTFIDTNSNGIQDAGDTALQGVVLRLTKSDGTPATDLQGNPVPNQTTSATGAYLFGNLPVGQYTVTVVSTPTGYVPTTAGAGTDRGLDSSTGSATSSTTTGTTATPGGSDLTLDFGFVQQTGVSVGNFVWSDTNGNGTQDPGEVGVPGVTATISKVGGGAVTDVLGNPVTTTQVTPASGQYQFTNLAPGQYIVTFSTLPAGYTVTTTGSPTSNGSQTGANATDSNGLTATSSVLAAGQSDLTLDLGLVPPTYSLGNRVWLDANNNGVLDAGEVGLDGVTVRLLDATGNPTGQTTTTSNGGYYQFTGLAPNGYIVEVVPTVGAITYVSSTGQNGGNTGPYEPGSGDLLASGNNKDHGTKFGTGATATIRSGIVILGPNMPTGEGTDHPAALVDTTPDNQSNRTVDFGLFRPATLGNLVWIDNGGGTPANANNGRQDPNEPGLNGVTINVYSGSTLVATTTTTNNPATGQPGWYEVTNLTPGSYQVEFVPPTGYTFTAQGTLAVTSGSPTDTSNSQPTAANPRTAAITLAPGDNNPQLDAGLIVRAAPPVAEPIPVNAPWALVLMLLGLMGAGLKLKPARAKRSDRS